MSAKTRIFVDTGAWLALFYAKDQHHPAARNWFDQNAFPLVNSNYVVVETLNLIKSRVGQGLAEKLSLALRRRKGSQGERPCMAEFLAASGSLGL
ncbi:MAG: type II toxin-antitoxin system VapC family toxin [Candidatus Sericytochromatia bacterium]